jgi:DHA1 family multidrug resistance protein-like MFS transporter
MDTFRDSTFGQLVRFVLHSKYLPYPEERPEFHPPPSYGRSGEGTKMNLTLRDGSVIDEGNTPRISSDGFGGDEEVLSGVASHGLDLEQAITQSTTHHGLDRTLSKLSQQIVPSRTKDGVTLVDWYTTGTHNVTYPIF